MPPKQKKQQNKQKETPFPHKACPDFKAHV